jgi:hypothetical protein
MKPDQASLFARTVFRDTEPSPQQFSAVAVSAVTGLPDLEHVVGGSSEDGAPTALGIAGGRVYGLRVLGGDNFTCEMWSWARDKVDVVVTDSFGRIRRTHATSDVIDVSMSRTWRFSCDGRAVEATEVFEAENRRFSSREATCQALAAATGAVFEPARR